MRNIVFYFIFQVISMAATAQIHKCDVGNKTIYQDQPCAADEKQLPLISNKYKKTMEFTWLKLKKGMSSETVKQYFPAKTLEAKSPNNLILSNLLIDGELFYSKFEFYNGEFTAFTASSDKWLSNEKAKRTFESIIKNIRLILGKEDLYSLEEEKHGLYGGTQWIFDNSDSRGKIDIDIRPTTAGFASIEITFKTLTENEVRVIKKVISNTERNTTNQRK